MSPFSVGPYLGIDYIGLISCIISLLKIGASCASWVGRIWIIFSCIVIWLRNSGLWCLVFGVWYLVCLECGGLCLAQCWIFFMGGSGSWGDMALFLFGRWYPIVWFGVYGVNRMLEHSEDSERSIAELKLLFFQTLFECVVGSRAFSIHSILELIDLCTFWIILSLAYG